MPRARQQRSSLGRSMSVIDTTVVSPSTVAAVSAAGARAVLGHVVEPRSEPTRSNAAQLAAVVLSSHLQWAAAGTLCTAKHCLCSAGVHFRLPALIWPSLLSFAVARAFAANLLLQPVGGIAWHNQPPWTALHLPATASVAKPTPSSNELGAAGRRGWS